MAEAAVLSRALAHFEALHRQLHAGGFETSVDRWQNVYDLLVHLGREDRLPDDIAGLQPLLSPLLCASADQQADFARLFQAWVAEPTHASPLNAEVQADAASIATARRVRVARRWWPFVVLGAVVAGLALAWALGVFDDSTVIVVTTGAGTELPSTTQPVDPSPLASSGERTARDIVIRPVPPRSNFVPPTLPQVFGDVIDRLGLAMLALPLLLSVLWLAHRYRARQALLGPGRAEPDDPFAKVRLQGGKSRPFWGGQVPALLQQFRRGAAQPVRRLDAERTVVATVRNAGLFEPVFGHRRWRPEFVILVHTGTDNGGGAGLADALIERLAHERLAVHRFDYEHTPSRCRDARGRLIAVHRIASRFADARLMVIGDASSVVQAQSGAPLPVLDQLQRWSARAWLTVRPAPWRHAEYLVAMAGFAVAPLTGDGLVAVSRWLTAGRGGPAPWFEPPSASGDARFPTLLRLDPESWLRRAGPPAGVDLPTLDDALLQYLDQAGVRLLAALAAYPRLDTGLMLALDEQLFPHDASPRRERRLSRLAALPWARFGHLPAWLREHLLRRLPAEDRDAIALAYSTIFERVTAEARPGALTLSLRQPAGGGIARGLKDLIKLSGGEEPAADDIFAQVVLGGRFGLLDFALPRRLARMLPGVRWQLRLAAGVLVSAALGTGVLAAAWHWVGAEALTEVAADATTMLNSAFDVTIVAADTTRPLAYRLQAELQIRGMQATVAAPDDGAPGPTPGTSEARWFAESDAGNLIAARGWPATLAARQVGEVLASVSYGEVLSVAGPSETAIAALPGRRSVRVWLGAAPGGGGVFRDALAYAKPDAATVDDPSAQIETTAIRPEMVLIPGGTFVMGSPEDEPGRDASEGPQREVSVAPFLLARTEVTFAEYERFAAATGVDVPNDRGWGRGLRPVINVSWNDAQAYAAWLSGQTGEQYRLPSEAEWEYAARAGTSTAYWWGDEVRPAGAGEHAAIMANCNGCGSERYYESTAPVGSFPANPFGLLDLHGNVWEWVQDCWHDDYGGAPLQSLPPWEESGADCAQRVLRDGSWNFGPRYVRSAARDGVNPDFADNFVGFRLARTP